MQAKSRSCQADMITNNHHHVRSRERLAQHTTVVLRESREALGMALNTVRQGLLISSHLSTAATSPQSQPFPKATSPVEVGRKCPSSRLINQERGNTAVAESLLPSHHHCLQRPPSDLHTDVDMPAGPCNGEANASPAPAAHP
jgi:hypothetical protein